MLTQIVDDLEVIGNKKLGQHSLGRGNFYELRQELLLRNIFLFRSVGRASGGNEIRSPVGARRKEVEKTNTERSKREGGKSLERSTWLLIATYFEAKPVDVIKTLVVEGGRRKNGKISDVKALVRSW